MNSHRRDIVKLGGVLGLMVAAGLLTIDQANAQQPSWNKAAFEAKNLEETVRALGGSTAVRSGEITITAPDIAEHGAVVPVAVASTIPDTQAIYILVEKNPNLLAAGFSIPAGTEPNVATRIKMGESSNVHALVKAGDRFFVTTREVKVTLGGCGG
jgi:sulfur-oxidizing protein SoxY